MGRATGGMLTVKTVAGAISAFGASLKPKLSNAAIVGTPEDQLRGPLETLVRDLAIGAAGRMRSDYRYDIDGLRAVAVLLVVIFHIDERLVPAGFVGVDIFFVISGFLITGNILRDRDAGTFSYAEFYRRRIKRIFPAMFLVTGATLLAGAVLMLPSDLVALSATALATSLSAANIYFALFLDTGYFADDSRMVPLLHMWSLGVEEQFYVIWPAMLLLLAKWPRAVLPALFSIILASILLGEWWLRIGWDSAAYYLLPTRAFQLAAGGVCALLLVRLSASIGSSTIAAAVGATLVGASAFFLDGVSLFPGLQAIPVTAGAALLLMSGQTANPVSRILYFAPLRAIGIISYSLYLWHWPVLAFARYFYGGELSPSLQAGTALTMFVLSVLSWKYVEVPARVTRLGFVPVAIRAFVAPVAVLSVVASVLILSRGMLFHNPSYAAAIAQASRRDAPSVQLPFVCQEPEVGISDIQNPACIIGSTEEPAILLWGDSHAAHFVGTIGEIAGTVGFDFRNIAHSACPPVFDSPEKYVSEKGEAECKASSEAVKAEIGKYSTVIIAASWGNEAYQTSAFRADLRSTVRQLTSAGASVVLVADIPRIPNFDARCEAKAIKFPWWDCTDRLRPRLAMVDKANASIRSTAVEFGAAFVDFSNFICTKGLCSNRIGGEPAYYDGRHLSFAGSVALGKLAAQDPAIQDAFAQFRSSTTATSQQALPWRTDPTGVFERMTSISEIVASADAMLVDRWVGRTRATPFGSTLLFSDTNDSAYASWSLQLTQAEMAALLEGGTHVVIEFTLRADENSIPMLKVTGGTEAYPVNYDILAWPTAGVARVVNSTSQPALDVTPQLAGGARYRVAIPIKGPSLPRIMLLPAAGHSEKLVDSKATGSMELLSMRIFSATMGGELESAKEEGPSDGG